MITRPASPLSAILLILSVAATWCVEAATPDACKFLTPALVSAAIGQPVTGGTMSMVDHSGASKSSCMYRAGMLMVVLSVDERGSAAAALQEYKSQLDNSHSRDTESEGSSSAQKTVPVSGIGEAAFTGDMINGSALEILAVHGSQVFDVGIVGGTAAMHAQELALMKDAISH